MAITLDGTSGVTTPGVVNTAAETIATTLAVTGVTTLQAGTAALPALTTTGDTNTGVFFPAADTVATSVAGVEGTRLTSTGLGIGTSSPIFLTDILSGTANTGANVNNPSQLSVTGANKTLTGGGATVFVNSNSNTAIDTGGSIALTGRNTTSLTTSYVWGVIKGAKENGTSTNGAGYLAFATASHSAGASVEAVRIDSVGNVTLQKNISVGAAAPTTSGTGITFPATQSASTDANTLDDYEEGIWTPTVTNMTTTGSPAYAGVYTKIGNLVMVNFYSTNAVATTYASTLNSTNVTGLPFTMKNTSTALQTWTGTCGNGNTTAGGIVGGQPTGTQVYFFTSLIATGGISFSVTYLV